MQQKTHDFLVRMQVPMATFGGDLMGEAIDFAILELQCRLQTTVFRLCAIR